MRFTICAVGRIRRDPAAALVAEYSRRLFPPMGPLEIREVEPAADGPVPQRREREAAGLSAVLPADAVVVAMDPRGRDRSSEQIAASLADWRDGGVRDLAFLIGGADGLAPDLVARAGQCWAFGTATWPHLLMRAMLAEQIYRAVSILAGHPYHRA